MTDKPTSPMLPGTQGPAHLVRTIPKVTKAALKHSVSVCALEGKAAHTEVWISTNSISHVLGTRRPGNQTQLACLAYLA